MNTSNQLVVRNIIGETIGGFVRVTISNELFNKIRGFNPELAYEVQGSQDGKGVRIFTFGEVRLYANYDKDTRKTVFLMRTADAQAHLKTLADERADEPKLAFDVSQFNTVVTA